MTTRALVIGLDGFDLGLVRDLGEGRLPNVHRLMRRGAFSALRSVSPPATLPNWTTFLTGLDPAQHGVFDFTTRTGYRVQFTAGTVREAPTVLKRLDERGLRCACLSFPATWPPERLKHGAFVSGWDAPVAFEANRSFVWPPSLYDETVDRFGTPTFDDVDEFHADTPRWIDRLPQALERRIHRKTEWATWLLERQRWDVFAVYFGESDTASHYLWAHHDPRSPRRPSLVTDSQSDGLARTYRALDAAIGTLLRCGGGDSTEVTLLSDHGSGGSSDKVLYLNRLLEANGLLRFSSRRSAHSDLGLKELALRRLPPWLRELLFRFRGGWLPSRLESKIRFGAIDMKRTIAFSDELNYFPGVHLNLEGREPNGIVTDETKEEAILRVTDALHGVRDPWSGNRVVKAVHRREQVFSGPYVDRAPDLLIDFDLDDGFSYNLMPTSSAPTGTGPWRKLGEHEKLGKKGRSLPGSHRARGFLAIAGPRVRETGEVDAHIADATATLLARLDVSVPSSFAGRVLWEALVDNLGEPLTLPEVPIEKADESGNRLRVEERLRALGYIE